MYRWSTFGAIGALLLTTGVASVDSAMAANKHKSLHSVHSTARFHRVARLTPRYCWRMPWLPECAEVIGMAVLRAVLEVWRVLDRA